MNVEATFRTDRSYYELFYSEWLRHRSVYRRFALPIAILILCSAVVTFYILTANSIIPWVLVVIGLVELIDAVTHRARWMRQRVSPEANQSATIKFTDDEIEIQTTLSQSRMRYGGFQDVAITRNGVFMLAQPKVSIFVPFAAIQSKELVPVVVGKLQMYAKRK